MFCSTTVQVPSEDGESTPSSPSEEKATTDNIAFMITKTAVQALSSGEVRDIVSRQGEDVQTVNIDAKKEPQSQQEGTESEEPVVCLDKKPVIIIFDEPTTREATTTRSLCTTPGEYPPLATTRESPYTERRPSTAKNK